MPMDKFHVRWLWIATHKLTAAAIVIALILGFCAGYLLHPLITPPPPKGKTLWEAIKERGYIVVATSPDWPPFEYIDPKTKKLVGYEIELMEVIAERLGIRVEWKTMDFDAIIPAVKAGEVDLGVSGFSVTPERMKEVLFTMPHIVTQAQLIMLKARAEELGITRLKSLEEIARYGLVVGTGSGTTQEAELLDLVKRGVISSDQVKSYRTFDLALEDLKAGRIDAVYAETPVTTWWISTEKVPMVVVYSRSYWPVAFIAPKHATVLVEKINAVLTELFATGEIDKIRAKWNVTATGF